MKIAVLAGLGRNPVSGAPRAAVNDAIALELARRLGADRLTLFHAGRKDDGLKDYLAYGAERIEIIPLAETADAVPALAARLTGYDLILTGMRAERGEASGLLPYLVAKALDRPIIAGALSLALAFDTASVTQFLPKGVRHTLEVALPAVIAVHPLAPVAPRYAYARRLAGEIALTPAAPAEAIVSPWREEAAGGMLRLLKAKRKQAGHDRMLGAIAPAAKGGTVLAEGSSADKARAILSYLRKHHLTEL